MNMRSVLIALAATFTFGLAWGEDSRREAAPEAESDVQSSQNGGHFVDVCFGGLHAGKVIIAHSRAVADDDLETTMKACRIDGGHRATVPRSPIIPAGSDAIA